MRIGILGAESGWHVRDLQRAARALGHEAFAIDFRRIGANIHGPSGLSSFDRMMVRTMPPGSLEQVIFRMDVLQRLEAEGIPILNPPRAVEICVDKYLASARLAAAGLRRSEEHTSELQSPDHLVCRLLLEKKKIKKE